MSTRIANDGEHETDNSVDTTTFDLPDEYLDEIVKNLGQCLYHYIDYEGRRAAIGCTATCGQTQISPQARDDSNESEENTLKLSDKLCVISPWGHIKLQTSETLCGTWLTARISSESANSRVLSNEDMDFVAVQETKISSDEDTARALDPFLSSYEINPFHKVPTINDGGFLLYESTAVCLYLLNKYAPGSDLYPKDLQKRARVDQILATVTSFVQPHYAQFYRNSIMLMKKPTAQQVQDLEETALKGMEHLVGDGQFAVGDALTLADLTLVAHLSFTIMLPVFDRKKFSKLVSYYERVTAKLPHFAETKTITEGLVQKWPALK